jgi:hypothetical protein
MYMWGWEKVYEWYSEVQQEEREESFSLLAEERIEEREEEKKFAECVCVFGSSDGWHITTRP